MSGGALLGFSITNMYRKGILPCGKVCVAWSVLDLAIFLQRLRRTLKQLMKKCVHGNQREHSPR